MNSINVTRDNTTLPTIFVYPHSVAEIQDFATMSVTPAPAQFNAEEADNFEDIEKQFAVKGMMRMIRHSRLV